MWRQCHWLTTSASMFNVNEKNNNIYHERSTSAPVLAISARLTRFRLRWFSTLGRWYHHGTYSYIKLFSTRAWPQNNISCVSMPATPWPYIYDINTKAVKSMLPSIWAFKIKMFPEWLIKKSKMSFCTCGDQQLEDINHFEIHAPGCPMDHCLVT